MKRSRTLGWIQNAANTHSLKDVVSLFIFDSTVNKDLRETKIPRLISNEADRKYFIELLSNKGRIQIAYTALKGKGTAGGGTRKTAPCSGIIQATVHGQGKKEYIDDWSSDCFLRWAISLGFIDYDGETDLCSISEFGIRFAHSSDNSIDEKEILGTAYLSYPPAVRVLSFLDKYGHSTKFEIGSNLGIIGEAGFTSIPQNIFIQGLNTASTQQEKTEILQNAEGDSDKYARMICGWLVNIGWVKRESKTVAEKLGNTEYTETISSAFVLTLEGKTKLKQAFGKSRVKKIPKIVYWEMLATKPSDKEYLRTRRAHIIQYIAGAQKTLNQIQKFLATKEFFETEDSILDDIHSFENIGLTVNEKNGAYEITDTITHLSIPNIDKKTEKADITVIKDTIRANLQHIDHKYLNLIDLSFDGKANRDFEIQTIALLTNELDFDGVRLGEASRPDGIVYHDINGVIIDTKAYSKGYDLPIGQRREMQDYIEDNQKRDAVRNKTQWWLNFPQTVSTFTFLFVSSLFAHGIAEKIERISLRTKTNGAVINSQNLLLLAEELKARRISYADCFELFGSNKEISVDV